MSNPTKILVVDDDTTVTDFLEIKLGELGRFEVRTTNDGRDAEILAASFKPDLILCDIDMPDMDGGDVFNAIQSLDQQKEVPFLFITSFLTKDLVNERGGIVGGKMMISKDASIEDLIARIDTILS